MAVPHWDDRTIGESTGLTAAAVCRIRRLGVGAPDGRQSIPPASSAPRFDRTSLLRRLGEDPAPRLTDHGRYLLRGLHGGLVDPDVMGRLIEGVPEHCVVPAAELTTACANDSALRRRGRATA